MTEKIMHSEEINKEIINREPGENRVYRLHQAFENVYTHLERNANGPACVTKEPLQYHHCPGKLSLFSDNDSYYCWGVELYENGQALLHALSHLVHENERAHSKSEIKVLLAKLEILTTDLHDYRVDVAEYQCCLLAKVITQPDSYVEVLSDLIRYLDSLENRLISTANRKIAEINTSKMTMVSLLLSLSAVLMTAILVIINIARKFN